jgi:hypothetical protein
MTKSNRILLFSVALLILGAAGPAATLAKGPPVSVQEADPNTAVQGEVKKFVILKGKGFVDDPGNTQVLFIISSNGQPAKIKVSEITFNKTTGNIEFLIDVPLDTDPVGYDIEVEFTTSGRRGKGTDLFSVKQSGGGNVLPTYDVAFDGDLGDSFGLKWQSDSKQSSITYFASDAQGGLGFMDLSYFRLGFEDTGLFDATQGMNCFDEMTSINAVQFFPDKNGDAILKGSFSGFSNDRTAIARPFIYHFTLTGDFDNSSDWLPQDSTTVTITSWKLKLASKQEDKRYSDITCTGAGTIAATIEVFRND